MLIEKEPIVAPCMLKVGLKCNPALTAGGGGGLAAGPVAAKRALAASPDESEAVRSVTSGLACGERSGLLPPSSSLELSDKRSYSQLAASGALFCPTSPGSSSDDAGDMDAMLLPHTQSQVHTPQSQVQNCAVSLPRAGSCANLASFLFRAGRRPSGPSFLFLPAPPVSYA